MLGRVHYVTALFQQKRVSSVKTLCGGRRLVAGEPGLWLQKIHRRSLPVGGCLRDDFPAQLEVKTPAADAGFRITAPPLQPTPNVIPIMKALAIKESGLPRALCWVCVYLFSFA